MSADNSGPAFPVQVRREEKYMDEGGYGRVRSFLITEGGMSLRDYFAAKAMQGELAAMNDPNNGMFGIDLDSSDQTLDRLAQHLYRLADAMLAARTKP